MGKRWYKVINVNFYTFPTPLTCNKLFMPYVIAVVILRKKFTINFSDKKSVKVRSHLKYARK